MQTIQNNIQCEMKVKQLFIFFITWEDLDRLEMFSRQIVLFNLFCHIVSKVKNELVHDIQKLCSQAEQQAGAYDE